MTAYDDFGFAGFSSRLTARPSRVELDDAVALGIADLVAEHRRARLARGGAAQVVGEVRAVEDVVAKRERDAIVADELAADEERLREPVGAGLRRVADLECRSSRRRRAAA